LSRLEAIGTLPGSRLHCVGRVDPLDLGVHELSRDRIEIPPRIENPLDDLGVRCDLPSIPPNGEN
jgi:hypothetical protein